MGTSTMLGHRRDGRPIYLIQGGAEDAAPPVEAAPIPIPAAPPVAPPADDSAALRAELAAAKAEAAQSAERLRTLMAGGGEQPPAAADDDDEDDSKDAAGKPVDPEMAKLRRSLREANRESKSRRESAEKLKADWEAQDKARQEQLAEAQRLSDAADKARLEAEARYKPATIRAAAVPALLAAGAKSDRADKLVRLLDMAAVDVDAAGEVTGLTEQIATVKADYPELFASGETERRPVPRVSGGDRPPAEQQPARSADRLAAQVLGGAA